MVPKSPVYGAVSKTGRIVTCKGDKGSSEQLKATIGVASSEIVLLLEHCDAAMTAASSQLWDMNRDLAIELNRRAARCRIAIQDMQQNDKMSHE